MKKLQNQAAKNITSDMMNRMKPYFRPIRTTGVWSPTRLSAITSDHQPNMTYSTPTKPIRNIHGPLSWNQSTAPNSITKPETDPSSGQIEGFRM